MEPSNIYKYIYFLVLILLIIGYFLLSKKYLKYKYSIIFYIRFSIMSYLFYVLSDSLLYTCLFIIFILYALDLYHKNEIKEHMKNNNNNNNNNNENDNDNENENENENNIDMYNNRKTIENFFLYGNQLLDNEQFINDYKNNKINENNNLHNLSSKVKKFKEMIKKVEDK